MKTKYRRVGNVELRYSTFNESDEIVLWYPNSYYNKEKEYLKNGWVSNKDGSLTKDNCTLHSGCFKNKENCYVVAFIDWNNAKDEFDIRIVGTRYWSLSPEDKSNFDSIAVDLVECDEYN